MCRGWGLFLPPPGAYVLGVGFGFFSGTEKNKEGNGLKPA
jgi:hypothetical protein